MSGSRGSREATAADVLIFGKRAGWSARADVGVSSWGRGCWWPCSSISHRIVRVPGPGGPVSHVPSEGRSSGCHGNSQSREL